MQIYVDADACPVVDIVEKIAKKYQISVTLLCDTNHILTSGYARWWSWEPGRMLWIIS